MIGIKRVNLVYKSTMTEDFTLAYILYDVIKKEVGLGILQLESISF
jgi:hypothetical protein